MISELAVFPAAGSFGSERFGAALAASARPVVCYCTTDSEHAARGYLERIGCGQASILVRRGEAPLAELEREPAGSVLPIIVLSALDHRLKDCFFEHPGLQLFADHHYMPRRGHESPELFTIGTTAAALATLEAPPARAGRPDTARPGDRRAAPDRLGRVVRSPAVREVRLHALGPAGTNISQACEHFIAREGIADKTTLIVHDRKIEPREYAAIARSEVRPGVLPLHVECAVYYGLRALYDERPDEVIFASQLYMPLDTMQLACRDARGLDARRGSLVIASHPSPLGLVKPLLAAGGAAHRHASSNADAAAMVRLGDADLCITTEAAGRRHGLHTLHRFGSPTMLFTIAASVTDRVLRDYLVADPEENHACPISASISPRNASRTGSPSRSWL